MSSQKLKIVFHPFPGIGCINSLTGIAQKLHHCGHRIIFIIHEDMKHKLCTYGFELIVLPNDSEGMSIEIFANLLSESGYFDSSKSPLEKMKPYLSERMPLMVDTFKIESIKFKEILDNVEPNIIITNINIVPSIIKSGYPWVYAVAMNPLNYLTDERTPPMNSGLPLYDNSQWSKYYDEFYQMLQPLIKYTNKWLKEEDISPLRKNQWPFVESPFLNIYNMPKELDYTHIRPLPKKWTQFDSYIRLENEKFEIPEHLANKNGKLIYLTMGSMLSVNVEMMKRLIEILKDTPYRYIVSKGPFADRYDLPDNMCGDRMVPQTKVLPLVDMIMFHGGHNTLVEAFHFGIPMIVMPLGIDAYDNAQRVVEEGFGIKLDPMNCTKEELINAIGYILNNNDLKKRFKKVSERIQNEFNSNKLVHAIESIVESIVQPLNNTPLSVKEGPEQSGSGH